MYVRTNGIAFWLVVEGAPGPSGLSVGRFALSDDPTMFPDLQVEVSQQLGNGSAAVCDSTGSMAGGVPAINPPRFDPIQDVIDAVNDLGCRFLDGGGTPMARKRSEACAKIPPTDDYTFVSDDSTVQFCAFIDSTLAFSSGDTIVTARLRDDEGNPGVPEQLLVHVGP